MRLPNNMPQTPAEARDLLRLASVHNLQSEALQLCAQTAGAWAEVDPRLVSGHGLRANAYTLRCLGNQLVNLSERMCRLASDDFPCPKCGSRHGYNPDCEECTS